MTIRVYSTHTCPFCEQEKSFLKEHEIPFQTIFVDDDPDMAEEMIQISGQMGVPFTLITTDDGEEHQILGFDKTKLQEILKI